MDLSATRSRSPSGCRIRELKEAFGPEIYAEVQDSLKNWWSLGYFQRTDREMLFRERGVKQFIESGAVMGMGTDSGTPMNFHSEALWREIKVHVDMGMTPTRAIAAATRVNAQIIGKGRDLGTIEPGKLADIIVVNGNPLFDIIALSHVEVVVKDGVVYKGGPAAVAGAANDRRAASEERASYLVDHGSSARPHLARAVGDEPRAPRRTAKPVEWPFYGGDQGGTKYSPLDQINRENVGAARARLGVEDRRAAAAAVRHDAGRVREHAAS